MITLKSSHELDLMRQAGKITAAARALAGAMVAPGVSTREIDRAVHRFIKSQGAAPSFLGYNGFPASVCISVNDEVIHGIPGSRVLREGDIVSVDVGAFKGGYHGDCAAIYPCGKISDEARRLIEGGTIGGGMLPKLNNCIEAIENGVSRVHILDGRIAHCLLLEIFTNKGIGTAILSEGEQNYYDGE